ncbi:hypothetical protein BGZ94_008436 [Podila epigama]|nr:hypothetical protein BGZ94_008436 [Podila epigama]
MDMFNTDSGFRPPSPLNFAPPSQGLFGEPLGLDEFRFNGQDFINLPTSPLPMATDPSMSLFNPSEQRYFSEFLDTLVVDQDFTFDPSSIPNLPNLPLFSPDTMPSRLLIDPMTGATLPNASSPFGNPAQQHLGANSMDFDMTSPSSQSSFSHSSLPNHYGRGGFPSPQGESPISPISTTSLLHYTSSTHPISIPSKRNKTNKGNAVSVPSSSRKGNSSSVSNNRDATPIQQQLSKLSLNGKTFSNGTNTTIHSRKNKRGDDEDEEEDELAHIKDRDAHERNASVSDGSISDSGVSLSATTPTSTSTRATKGSRADGTTASSTLSATTKRKPYKELLTEEEKRANHIASEQKRRNTIRNGFKDMTELIPDLKDLNSSKSTILFKAVDFIKHLEQRNQILQEKASRLESRLLSQREAADPASSSSSSSSSTSTSTERLQEIPHIYPVSCSR